ncbi:MAG: FAD-dependent monooxygenase [Dactylosporangium sp.]|nr:FAD-dependent monooxygenase [Dactylosporangium sp.]NNJ59468.1 FAD-dependent monooxygenase [Dactylosporangium sp.]
MRTAIVVGAGIAGLATAGALARTGWKVTLLERDERLRPGRAALILWPNGVRALRALGLAGGLDGIATPIAPSGIRRPNGQWLTQPDRASASTNEPPLVVHQEDLHDAFIAGLGDQVDVRTGITVRAARATADRPAVSDGQTTFEADLVVAADGVDSAVRSRLAAESVFATAGYAAWKAFIPAYRAPKLAADVPSTGETLGEGHRFVHVVLGERRGSSTTSRTGVYWVATAPGAPRPEPEATQLSLLRRWFAGWPAPTGDLLAATEPDDLVQDAVGELRPLPASMAVTAGTGGYVFVGDAGHAMTHYLGQGACLALEDAATLQVAVRSTIPGRNLGQAIEEYSRLRRPRVAKVAARSRRVGSALQGGTVGGFGLRARNAALGRFLPRLLDRAAAESVDWYPPTG